MSSVSDVLPGVNRGWSGAPPRPERDRRCTYVLHPCDCSPSSCPRRIVRQLLLRIWKNWH